MRTSCSFACLLISTLFIPVTFYAQGGNFDETWMEFLKNNKISNMSELTRPDKVREQQDYAKYLLMNTNSDFCQSRMKEAEGLMTEIQGMDPELHKSIPGYVKKMTELETKIKAHHSMDVIWQQFLSTESVSLEELEAVEGAKTSCEKKTLAKYSYMTAYQYFCDGNIQRSKDIFETRTLRLAEKTTLRIKDVEGLPAKISKMKTLYQDIPKLEAAWDEYVKTGVSPGFDIDLPLFLCNPTPNIKEYILKGATDDCSTGPEMLEKIKKLQAESGMTPKGQIAKKLKDLEKAIKLKQNNLAGLNKAWEAFIPDNKVRELDYGYVFCSPEPLIRAYIMDGFAFTCDLAEERLRQIDSIHKADNPILEEITMIKIGELSDLFEQYQFNGVKIEQIWNEFVADGDVLSEAYESTDEYCDYIQNIKDWTMKGLSSSCEEATQYLDKIEEVKKVSNWIYYEELECRVKKLRVKVWECRYQALQKLAELETSPDSYDEKLKELMDEYGMEERPEECSMNK